MENERHELQSVQRSSFESISQKYGVQYVLEFSPLDVPDDEYTKISKVWEKSTSGDPNHPQHYIEIAFTPGQSLVSNEKPEDYSVPVFFHVQCSLAAPTLVNGKFRNCLRTMEMNKNEEYKYLHHFVPKHILYIPVRVTSFREIHFDFTNDLNQTLSFSSGSSVIILCFRAVLL